MREIKLIIDGKDFELEEIFELAYRLGKIDAELKKSFWEWLIFGWRLK